MRQLMSTVKSLSIPPYFFLAKLTKGEYHMSKKLSLSAINKQYSDDFSKLKRVHLKNDHYVDIQTKFEPTKIEAMISEYQDLLRQLTEIDEIKIPKKVNYMFLYTTMIIKYFSSIGSIIPNDIVKVVVLSQKLFDTGITDEIISQFDPEELEKLYTKFEEVNASGVKMIESLGEAAIQKIIEAAQKLDSNLGEVDDADV